MLSTAISDEIYHRTLGLLMTTPVNSFQIVMGKLFSKLLQLLLLLAISLPLLAVVRVFGGVPWSYVVSSLLTTFSTVIFLGSLSLFFSIFTRKAYAVIIMTCLTAGALFAVIPLLGFMTWHVLELRTVIALKTMYAVFLVPNPYCNLFLSTMLMLEPRVPAMMPSFSGYLNCGIILAGSAALLFVCVVRVRKIALRQAVGQLAAPSRKPRRGRNSSSSPATRSVSAARTRRVKGPPIIWKELRFPLLGRRKVASLAMIAICLLTLFVTYLLCAIEGVLGEDDVHDAYAVIFLVIGILFSTVLASTCITSEKEARSWPLLMATTLDDGEIAVGKLVGVVRRCFPAWLPLMGHIVLFSLAGIIHPVAIFQMGLLVAWIVVFLAGTGLYFSSCFKRTTTAVLMNLVVAGVIWAVVSILLGILGGINHKLRPAAEVYFDTNPFIHAVVITEAAVRDPGSYRWFSFRSSKVSGGLTSTIWMLVCAAGYMSLGLLFAWRAKHRFRRSVF
jgi:ABC-type transport system involved in multi-copper enzyme maturation permease subunit